MINMHDQKKKAIEEATDQCGLRNLVKMIKDA